MTATLFEADELVNLSEFEDVEIPCDISKLRSRAMSSSGLPDCPDYPAKWVGWRSCPCGIKYRLVCDFCKNAYQIWTAKQASISCVDCGEDTGGFHHFTPLVKG